jgi:2-keto-4-pentenoate hydratase/2-oxohepta-3-ene-1,7-dioic acid hydratase in catechol pathway
MSSVLFAPAPRIVVFETRGQRRIGVAAGDRILDVTERYPDVGVLLAADPSVLNLTVEHAASFTPYPLAGVRLLPPLDLRARIFCLALNYQAHADESGGADPGRPVIFHKLDTSLIGPFDPIETPGYTDFLDYEAELAVVIGATARLVPAERWREFVGGYSVFNDISCRDAQATKLGEQTILDWFSAKAADRTTPVGPWIVPASEIEDPQRLQVSLQRNGETLQDASTALMIFKIPRIIEFLAERVTLRPGDVIATGTPGGVGKARGIRLVPGDIIETSVERVGTIRNEVVGARVSGWT